MRIVVLTGAGISAESGVPTFRAPNSSEESDGLWCGHRVEAVATPEGFAADPALVQDFYNQRRRQLREVEPNAAHHALARLAASPHEVLVITQNVDDLHDRAHATAGVASPLHMHGELLKARHIRTGAVQAWSEDIPVKSELRPHIVWFGEMPLEMERIDAALDVCDLFVSIGTSGNVYPAAGFVSAARTAGARTIELNLEPSLGQSLFHEAHYGPATQVVPAFVDGLLT